MGSSYNYGFIFNMRKRWDYDSCFEEAKKYTTKTEFTKGKYSAYISALENGWLSDYSWFKNERKITAEKLRKWNYETCYEAAKKYKYQTEFQKNCSGAHKAAWKNGWLKDYTWFESGVKINAERQRIWDKESCYDLAKQCKSRSELKEKNNAAYNTARKNGWLKDYVWLKSKAIDLHKGKIDSVYAYEFSEQYAVYVGRTLIRCRKNRDRQHIFTNDSVSGYAKQLDIPIPPMKVLEENLTLEEGSMREGVWLEKYKQDGWIILNRAKTGSLGGVGKGKWTKKICFEEAKKYTTLKDFQNGCKGACVKARAEGWLKDYTWLKRLWKPKWNYETCYQEAKKYTTKKDFNKNSGTCYATASKNKWLDDYTWLIQTTKPNGYWKYDTCFQEAKKYITRRDFSINASGAYDVAMKNKWLDDYTWFISGFEKNKKWTQEAVFQEAKKYKTKGEFAKENASAYNVARTKGWINEYEWFDDGLKIMGNRNRLWNYDTCYREAQKYTNRTDYSKGSGSAYNVSKKNNWLDDYTWFVQKKKPNGWWTYERCFEEVKKYHSLKELELHNKTVYNISHEKGWIESYTWLRKIDN